MMLCLRNLENSKFPNYNLVTLHTWFTPKLVYHILHDGLDEYLSIRGQVVGSCNDGLLLLGSSYLHYPDNWFYICNLAMRTKSKNFTIFFDSSLSIYVAGLSYLLVMIFRLDL
jgi:hypothetical protein